MDSITIGILVLIAVLAIGMRLVYQHLRDRIDAVAQFAGGKPTLFASADGKHRNPSRIWTHLLVPVLAGVFLTQILQLAGCNTTPTQSRLEHDEQRIAKIEDHYVPREEHKAAQDIQTKLFDQREARIVRLEGEVNQLFQLLIEKGR